MQRISLLFPLDYLASRVRDHHLRAHLRANAPHHGAGAHGYRPRLRGLQFLRPPAQRRAPARLYRLQSFPRHHGLHDRRHHGPAGARGGDLRLHVRDVRDVPLLRQGLRFLLRLRFRDLRPSGGRSGQDRGRVIGFVRHDLGQPDLGRGDHRRHYHPDDDTARLSPLGRGRDRGRGLDRRQLDAAGDGFGRVHHGGIHRHRIRRHRQGRAAAGAALLRRRVFPGSFSRLPARPRCASARSKSRSS